MAPAYCIVKNILQRGAPTLMSRYLKAQLELEQEEQEMSTFHPLLGKGPLIWERVIRGDDYHLNFPAKRFLEELWTAYLPEYDFCRPLILPEVPINTITQVETAAFIGQQVDFYLPQAFMVIEIDGGQHRSRVVSDRLRDDHLARFGIQTVRITTSEISTGHGLGHRFAAIRNRIQETEVFWEKERAQNPLLPILDDYRRAFEEIEIDHKVHVANAAIRFQLLLLELMLEGRIEPEQRYRMAFFDRDVSGYQEAAANDLCLWLKHLCQLQKVPFASPSFDFEFADSLEELTKADADFWVDFSMHQRYTDLFQNFDQVIFVRTDYLDHYKYYKKANGQNPEYVGLLPYDHFQIATSRLISYNLKSYAGSPDEESLKYIISNVFLPELDEMSFNPGQLPIIMNAMARAHTIGLLPTGGGKSLCYQVAALLQPGISFVVCPIKSLMFDQKLELDAVHFSRTAHITGNDDGEDRARLQKDYAAGKYFFVFISPERFQTRSFREYLAKLNASHQFAYAVIDEVHCLSEWGHDFRISYLNLAQTIRRFCGNFSFIALTATASLNVLKDIQIELGVDSHGVRTLTDYTRQELEFVVLDDNNKKEELLTRLLKEADLADQLFTAKSGRKSALVFTNTVNGSKGCFSLANKLSKRLEVNVPFYSGGVPSIGKKPLMSDREFEAYKEDVQKGFKQNRFPLLVATKAFGMGVNKKNIYYAYHFGIPGSMESLYQEAGRAGRDKKLFSGRKAQCYVLFGKTKNDNLLKQILARQTSLSFIKDNLGKLDGDINTNLFLFAVSNERIADEYKHIKSVLNYIGSQTGTLSIRAMDVGLNKSKLEKAIYRLRLLGVLEDWIVEDFFAGHFEIEVKGYSTNSVGEHLERVIRKYDAVFSLAHLDVGESNEKYYDIMYAPEREHIPVLDKYIVILLQWIYDHFAYNRRQSLKNIHENCQGVITGELSLQDFKSRLEGFFRFSEETHLLQHIAENPGEYEKWFELLTDKEVQLREKDQLQSLQASLSRFLESFEYNPGLDYLSGMLRLVLNDFANLDGEPRLQSAFREIKRWAPEIGEDIVERTLSLCMDLPDRQKSLLTRFLEANYSDSTAFLTRVQNILKDTYSLSVLMRSGLNKLTRINQHIYEQLESL